MTVMVEGGSVRERLSEALRQDWDPIGVGAIPEARDEYDAYVDDLARLVLDRATPSAIFDHLWTIETQHMGLIGDAIATRRFAEQLSATLIVAA